MPDIAITSSNILNSRITIIDCEQQSICSIVVAAAGGVGLAMPIVTVTGGYFSGRTIGDCKVQCCCAVAACSILGDVGRSIGR